jgi:hypothetical protein
VSHMEKSAPDMVEIKLKKRYRGLAFYFVQNM